jgi:hypothetical protein
MGSQSTTFQLILKFTHGSLQWIHKHNLSTTTSTQERMPHQTAWIYQAVVAGEEATLVISKGGKDDDEFAMLCSSKH